MKANPQDEGLASVVAVRGGGFVWSRLAFSRIRPCALPTTRWGETGQHRSLKLFRQCFLKPQLWLQETKGKTILSGRSTKPCVEKMKSWLTVCC